MGKKDKKLDMQAPVVEKRSDPDGGVVFEATDASLQSAAEQTGLQHVTKVWSRHAWERATPWILSQRQKLEGNGWTTGDSLRTELFVLKRNAPNGTFTDDGYIYMRVPKKMIDFFRSAKKNNAEDDEDGPATEESKQHKKSVSTRANKRREARCNYDLSDPNVWRIKIDGAESEEPGKEASVMIDVAEPLENIFNLVQCLQPGLARLHAFRDNVIQAGTHEVDERMDAEPPTARHRAMIAGSESYERVLPPPYWFKRNRDDLEKILGEGFEATLRASEDAHRCTMRNIKNIEEKVWEEVIKVDERTAAKKSKKKTGGRKNSMAAANAQVPVGLAAAA